VEFVDTHGGGKLLNSFFMISRILSSGIISNFLEFFGSV
jgi:hypothetical protein